MSTTDVSLTKTVQSFLLNEGLNKFTSNVRIVSENKRPFQALIVTGDELEQLEVLQKNPDLGNKYKFRTSEDGLIEVRFKREDPEYKEYHLVLCLPEDSMDEQVPVKISNHTVEITPPAPGIPANVAAPPPLPANKSAAAPNTMAAPPAKSGWTSYIFSYKFLIVLVCVLLTVGVIFYFKRRARAAAAAPAAPVAINPANLTKDGSVPIQVRPAPVETPRVVPLNEPVAIKPPPMAVDGSRSTARSARSTASFQDI